MDQSGVAAGRWWHATEDGRIQCDLCPRFCRLRDGQRGFCFVRKNEGDQMHLMTYGRASGFCLDPIEKKPLNHFLPGTSVLSFGTAGCNLGCRFCQNWDISKAREADRLNHWASPESIARAAKDAQAASVAVTYNDPVIFAEYAIDTAQACRDVGVKATAVTAGYITPKARAEFFAAFDAVNIDLKAFTERFYHKLCFGHLQPVLETLEYVHRETKAWLEVTTLLIPGENDSPKEIDQLCTWFVDHLGVDVPLHLTAFHPDFKMLRGERTPQSTLRRAHAQALEHGLKYVYTGNTHDRETQSTVCASCGCVLIERDWYQLGRYHLNALGDCLSCGTRLPGVFADKPGTWGRQRQTLRIV